jgi:hypothetical protein
MKHSFLLAVAAFYVISCKNTSYEGKNIEAYYFPFNLLSEGKIYEYESVGNKHDPPIYWFFKSATQDGKKQITGTSFGPTFQPDQAMREEIVENGVLLRNSCVFEKDSTGNTVPIHMEIVTKNVFPFYVKKLGKVVITEFKWTSIRDTANYTFVRNRQFESDTTISFDGKNYDAVTFVIRELVDQEQAGHLALEYGGSEVYAKEIGLIYFSKDIQEGWQTKYQLKKIYSLQEFEQKSDVRLSELAFSFK